MPEKSRSSKPSGVAPPARRSERRGSCAIRVHEQIDGRFVLGREGLDEETAGGGHAAVRARPALPARPQRDLVGRGQIVGEILPDLAGISWTMPW